MPSRALPRYSRLSTIRLTPKDLFSRLLMRHADACRGRGLDPATLRDDERSNEALWRLFTRADALPDALLEALSRIDDLSDEAGHDALITEARGCAIDAGRHDLDPRALALATWLDHPEVFLRAHRRRLAERASRFREYPGREARHLDVPATRDIERLQTMLGAHFAARRRSPHCHIHAYQDRHRIHFAITHGRPYRADEALDDDRPQAPMLLHESWVAYRPQKHDLVIYDNRVSRLEINAADAATIRQYCEAFGAVLFHDRAWFQPGTVVTLGPLVELHRGALLPTPGIRGVELSQLMLRLDDDLGTTLTVGGRDVFTVLQRYQPVALTEGRLTWARLKVRYASGGRARKVEIRPPNQVQYDRRKHDVETLRFLEARGFLSGPADSRRAVA